MDASEGRRRKRKRDTTPDRAGLEIKRRLLEQAIQDDPEPDGFEGWLLGKSRAPEGEESSGARLAMARAILEEWHLARASSRFREWLNAGSPSDDRLA